MNELSLFTGAGGGVLGTHHLLGFKTCGYVEWNEYCQRVIAARIADGYLTSAPIFTDVREFVQSGAAEQYRGIADVVSAGFPCQPFSVAGKQKAENDERNMWPATRDVIRIVQPASVLLENVPGLVSCGYLGTVIADLAALGYVGKWGVIGAADCDAPHRRDRLWIVANTSGERCGEARKYSERSSERSGVCRTVSADVADACGRRRGDASKWEIQQPWRAQAIRTGSTVADANGAQRQGMRGAFGIQPEHANAGGSSIWWTTDPANDPQSGLGRMAPRMAYGVDRLTAIGNGQVSVVAARAWRELAA